MGAETSQETPSTGHPRVLYDKTHLGFYLEDGGGLKIEGYQEKVLSNTDIHASHLFPVMYDINNEKLTYTINKSKIPYFIPCLDRTHDQLTYTTIETKQVFYSRYKAKVFYYSDHGEVTINLTTGLCY